MADAPLVPVARPPGGWLRIALIAIAACAIVLPVLLVWKGPRVTPHRMIVSQPMLVVPKAQLPPVEPVAFQDLDPDDARSYNASIPFVGGPNPPARPFAFDGDDAARARATDCLAVAVLYEAGDDAEGQRAVAQVVLNRARHPAFPKTVCGVVFEGSDRTTGCQFTFTCDGALVRHSFSAQALDRARSVATAALDGGVFKPVGLATHYHTDWVVPYWQASLDKLAAVHTHLFFRWTGWWGTPAAFDRHISPDEPVIPALADIFDAHKSAVDVAAMTVPVIDTEAFAEPSATAGGLRIDPNSFVLKLDPHMAPDGYGVIAARTCGDRSYCKIMGWTDPTKLPTALPLNAVQVGTMSFSYLRDKAHSFDKTLWNCAEFKRSDKGDCMKQQVVAPAAPVARQLASTIPLTDTLAGVRRSSTPSAPTAPAAKPIPTAAHTPAPDGR
ncbi:MAG: cell wall hydrolase [Pseudomonadota bacterium]|nr:cell wall hydrolase [Pseudomonadota bacterium]